MTIPGSVRQPVTRPHSYWVLRMLLTARHACRCWFCHPTAAGIRCRDRQCRGGQTEPPVKMGLVPDHGDGPAG